MQRSLFACSLGDSLRETPNCASPYPRLASQDFKTPLGLVNLFGSSEACDFLHRNIAKEIAGCTDFELVETR